MFYPDEVTEDGQFKYFEYRYILKNLIPSVPYYIAVTAFDHGLPGITVSRAKISRLWKTNRVTAPSTFASSPRIQTAS